MFTKEYLENPPFPSFTQFETSTICNAKCVMCPHSKMKRKGKAQWSTISKIIREAAPKSASMAPFLMQEPMIEPRLMQILANIKQNNPNCQTVIYSNLGKLHKDTEKIVKYGLLGELHVSFYGPTKELYRKYQPPLNWETTKANIHRVKQFKIKYSTVKPVVSLQILAVEEIINEISKYDVACDVDHAGIVQFDTFHGDIADCGNNVKYLGKPAERTPCQRLWTGLNVHFDGSVVPCCIDWRDQNVLGNVKEQTLEEIWRGDKFREFRRLHSEGKWSQIPMCVNCKVHEYQFSKEWRELWLTKESPMPTC